MIVNKSMESGVVPDNMKKAKVIPLYKAKSKNEFANYRPISLLPTISKIIEKVLHQRLSSFLDHNELLYSDQYGFRKNIVLIML